MDYGVVENSKTSLILDTFVKQLGEPQPESIENPYWFETIDVNYNSVLAQNGVTFCEGVFLDGIVSELDDHSIHQEWKTLHEQCIKEIEENQPNEDALKKFNRAIGKSTNLIREKYGLSKEKMLAIVQYESTDKKTTSLEDTSVNQGEFANNKKKWWHLFKSKSNFKKESNQKLNKKK
jgi:hypothetical protein